VNVACSRPPTKQRLYLVVVGPERPDKDRLASDVLKAFLAERQPDKRWKTPAFDEVVVWEALGGGVSRGEVESSLVRLRKHLLRSKNPVNDVVVVFFSGEEVVENRRVYLLTRDSRIYKQRDKVAIDCGQICQTLAGFRGAKLVLLDARRKSIAGAKAAVTGDGRKSLAFYRYVWLGDKAAPEKARLVDVLERSLSQTARLEDQRRIMFGLARKFGPNVLLEVEYEPVQLGRLQLGKPKTEVE
jgi:hypothetical protein